MSENVIRKLTAFLVLGIACLAFAVSFEAIREYAARSGAVNPSLAWVIPLLVDTFIIVASLAIWLRSLDGERNILATLLLIVAASGSVILNIAHAPSDLSAQAVAAIPPAALIASFHVAMAELRRSQARKLRAEALDAVRQSAWAGERITAVPASERDAIASAAARTSERPAVQATRPAPATKRSPSPAVTTGESEVPDPRHIVRALWEDHELRRGQDLNGETVEQLTNGRVSRRRAEIYLKHLRNARTTLHQGDARPVGAGSR